MRISGAIFLSSGIKRPLAIKIEGFIRTAKPRMIANLFNMMHP
jgi:hypothetical protein